jgi:hypothetical protein
MWLILVVILLVLLIPGNMYAYYKRPVWGVYPVYSTSFVTVVLILVLLYLMRGI